MEEIKQKVQDLELALNYVCYDADLIPKLSKVWEKLELLQEVVNKKCNIPHVTNRYLFWSEDEGKEGWTFEIEANDSDEAYEKAYDTHGPQVEGMMYQLL